MDWDLREGAWEDVLSDVDEVDAVIADPPYSARTHEGHDDGANMANRAGERWVRSDGAEDIVRPRRAISYAAWGEDEIRAFVASWAPRNRGWFAILSDSELLPLWRRAFADAGLTTFQPLPIVIPGMTVRMAGDGPSSWAVYLNVARPKALSRWGTLPGAYTEIKQGEREHIGGKPLDLMRAIVRDYTRPGDLVCDPTAGAATTLLASVREGRNAIGAEVDPATYRRGVDRLRKSYTPDLFSREAVKQCAKCSGWFRLGAFARDRRQKDDRQAWCRRCKAEWEQGPENAWKRLRAWLEKEEPACLRGANGWTEALYVEHWNACGGRCVTCGAGLLEWQTSGHRLDRIDNNTPHIPSNCRMVCWPCNKLKSDGHALAEDATIGMWVQKYGRGKVPWHLVKPAWGIKRVELPDVEEYRAASPSSALQQQPLFLAGGAP